MSDPKSELIETWNLVRDLRNALAAAMRTLAAGGTCDMFITEAADAGVQNGIGQRSDDWLKRHSQNATLTSADEGKEGGR